LLISFSLFREEKQKFFCMEEEQGLFASLKKEEIAKNLKFN